MPSRKTMSENIHNWFSVNDKLPEGDTPVLVVDNRFFELTDGIGVAELIQFPSGPRWRFGGQVYSSLNPTHWSYLPKKPE